MVTFYELEIDVSGVECAFRTARVLLEGGEMPRKVTKQKARKHE